MYLETVLLLGLVQYLRKNLHTKSLLPRWDLIFRIGFWISIALILVSVFIKDADPFVKWISHLLVLVLVWLVLSKEELRPAKAIIYSILPLVILSFIGTLVEDIAPKFFNKWDEYFEIAIGFSFLWMLVMWIITRKQRKALEKERQHTLEIEKENQNNEKLKAMLEVQVAERTAVVMQQKEELQHALEELKATQSQLIQSEKMASLGELTAGIAHEIQNPLNFVNNFSEVSTELIEEMVEAANKGNTEEVKTIANDLKQNLEKINHHGKRADGIVKGMLLHSRTSSGQKELTDINALADEYLRLAYHGLRAKDKTFNAKFTADLDPSVDKINIVPQDFGRVILNLINNAFYAVTEKSRQAVPNYEPAVTVSTKKLDKRIEIRISDNGTGIPKKALDKIFQPFFTTKPTGQGTGLGLSLSYDIIKAHGGELKVETKEGQGTAFIIYLDIA